MANREKKPTIGKKSPLPPPPSTPPQPLLCAPQLETTSEEAALRAAPKDASAIAKKLSKTAAKRAIKKNIAIQLKATKKQQRPRTNQRPTKAIAEGKKAAALLKNGLVKQIRAKAKVTVKSEQPQEGDDVPPILEPIFPVEESADKKQPKKRVAKKKQKTEEELSLSSENPQTPTTPNKKPKTAKKSKSDLTPEETLEDVIKDLSSLIENNPKQESAEATQKPKKYSKKQLDALKRRLLKKENIENTMKKMDPSNLYVIDMLDLNVRKMVPKPEKKRRHSIEKFPVTSFDTPQLSLFNNLPRSISPRTRRSLKLRQSMENIFRRTSSYTTRSDSPARILRNGKRRKLKDFNLLDGLEVQYKKRRRLCSDFSGSEMSVSKVSGYDSDSSFSDLSSIHGTESSDVKETDTGKKEDVPENGLEIKPNISATDTNSNICSDVKIDQAEPQEDNQIREEDFENLSISPSLKVPDKSIILNIMKQTFNFTESVVSDESLNADKEKRTTRASLKKSEIPADSDFTTQTPSDSKEEVLTALGDVKKEEIVEDVNSTEMPEVSLDKEMKEADGAQEIVPVKEEKPELPLNDDVVKDQVETKLETESTELPKFLEIIETPENLAIKENILQALGLQSLKAAEEAKLKEKEKGPKSDYTGTLKTVIKLNRCEKKKVKNPLKMTLQKNKSKEADAVKSENDSGYKIMKEGGSSSVSWKNQSGQSSDTAGGHRKSHYSNRSNMDGSSEHTSDGDTAAESQTEGTTKTLVIPEKASSFSIHPGRLCKDECSYCFGKFGLFDTPCHIAAMKSVERQDKILATEKHLTRDSCLCDACYRHVDRKSNIPSYANKNSYKRGSLVAPGPRQNHCHVLGCSRVSSNILRRKWIIKMRKSVCSVINIDLDNPGLHSIPICDEHYAALEHLMVCAMCKRRLARNHIHYLGPECDELNAALNSEGIPVTLVDKPVVCKLCRYFATLVLKDPEERPENTKNFFREYKKRLLHFHDVELMDEAAAEEPIPVPTKDKQEKEQTSGKKKRKSKSQSDSEPPVLEPQVEMDKPLSDQPRVPSDSNSKSRSESPSSDFNTIDYKNLIPSIAMDCDEDSSHRTKKPTAAAKRPTVREAVEISKNLKIKGKSDAAVQRLGSNPSISVRQLFPGEEELGLQAQIDFGNVKERTPEGWEKCTATIQYDAETRNLWQELQKPYGNHSSFLRHLILLEKYFRNGDLVLSPNASHHSVTYSESVQNRLKAYDNVPVKQLKSQSGIVTSNGGFAIVNAANIPKNTPITMSQLSNLNKQQKSISVPPGLISLAPRQTAPPVVKVPQSQKIKFPITKHWRPNLMPIDPNKLEKKPGMVQVISAGKPYHISISDYKKMVAIKRSFEMKNKLLQETSQKSVLKKSNPKKTKTPEESSVSILEKLDKVVEKLEATNQSMMLLPKIPKSLTVIPQTVAKRPSRPSSPILMITSKAKTTVKS